MLAFTIFNVYMSLSTISDFTPCFLDHSGFHNKSRFNTFVTQSPGRDDLNKDKNLAAVASNSTPSLVEDLFLTSKDTTVPANPSPAAGEMPRLGMTSILDDRPEFKLLRCLSPLQSDMGDRDVPAQEPPHRQNLEMQNFPLWLSESPLKLDFPLSSMIDSSYPHPQPDLIACQNRSCPDLAETQELKTSFLQDDVLSGSRSNTIQHDVKDASEHPKQRKTRRRRLATQKSDVNGDANLENQDQVQPRILKCDDDPHCEDVKPSTSKARRVSARITNANRKAMAGVKRKKETSSTISKKMSPLTTDSETHNVLPKPKYTGIVESLACRSSLNIDQPLTSSLRDTSFSLQKFQGGKSEDENSKLMMNSREVIYKGICGTKKAETSVLINKNEDMEVSDKQVESLLSSGDVLDNVKCLVKDGEIEENSSRQASVLQNSDSQNEMGKDIQDQMTEISVPLTAEEDTLKEIMIPADRAKSPTEKDCDVSTNELTVMEGIEINYCTNPDSTPAEDLRDEQNLEDEVSNECSFEATSNMDKDVQAAHGVNTQDASCVADCLEKNEDLSWNKEVQMIEDTIEEEEAEFLGANELVEENALPSSDDRCWETTNAWDDDDMNEEGDQYSAGKIDEQTLLEEDESSEGHIASAGVEDDASHRGNMAKLRILTQHFCILCY